jgi:hypothetical protein
MRRSLNFRVPLNWHMLSEEREPLRLLLAGFVVVIDQRRRRKARPLGFSKVL